MNGYVDHVAKVGLLHIFVCFVRFSFPLVVVARLQHQLGMKGCMQLLRSIPAVVVPHKRQFSLKRFLSVKDSTARSPRWLTTTKESMNHSVASFVSPRLIEAYALSLLAASDARKYIQGRFPVKKSTTWCVSSRPATVSARHLPAS